MTNTAYRETPALDAFCIDELQRMNIEDLSEELSSLSDSSERDAVHYDVNYEREYYTGD